MKFLIAAALCLTFSAVFAKSIEEVRTELKEATRKCLDQPDMHVDKDLLKKYIDSKGTEPAPENLGHLALCVSKSRNWQHEDGTINRQHLIDNIRDSIEDKAKADEIINDCLVEQSNAAATARHLFKCFYKHH